MVVKDRKGGVYINILQLSTVRMKSSKVKQELTELEQKDNKDLDMNQASKDIFTKTTLTM